MYYCNKCKKEVNNKKDLYKGLCENCYREYLLEKIENIGNPEYFENNKNNFSLKKFIKKIINSGRNL